MKRLFFIFFLIPFVCVQFMNCGSTSVNSYVKRAQKLIKADKIEQAIFLYRKAIQKHPYRYELYINQAALFRKQKQFAHAIHTYKAALKINTKYRYAYYGIGLIYMAIKDYASAQNYFKHVEENFPEFHKNNIQLGALYYYLKETDLALEYLNKAINTYNLTEAYYYRGLVYLELLKDNDFANEDFERYIERNGIYKEEAKKLTSNPAGDFDF